MIMSVPARVAVKVASNMIVLTKVDVRRGFQILGYKVSGGNTRTATQWPGQK